MFDGRANLIKAGDRTPNQYRENGRKAGIASGAARRIMKTFKDAVKAYLDGDISPKEIQALIKMKVPLSQRPTNKKEMLILTVGQKCIAKGDYNGMMKLAELSGEHIDEKKILLEGDAGQRTIINLIPKGSMQITIKPEYIKGSVYGTDEE